MRRILCVFLLAASCLAPVSAGARAGDPDQPQNYCAMCRASGGAVWAYCMICRMQQAWDGLGDWWSEHEPNDL